MTTDTHSWYGSFSYSQNERSNISFVPNWRDSYYNLYYTVSQSFSIIHRIKKNSSKLDPPCSVHNNDNSIHSWLRRMFKDLNLNTPIHTRKHFRLTHFWAILYFPHSTCKAPPPKKKCKKKQNLSHFRLFPTIKRERK